MAANPFDAFDEPTPAAQGTAVQVTDPATGKKIWRIGQVEAAPESGSNPFDQFDEESAPTAAPQRSLGGQFWDATKNTVAGIGQGIAAIPDAAINAAGAIMGAGADALGFEDAAQNFRNPITIGGTIEKAAPTPADGVGKGVRFASQLSGGLLNIPGVTSVPNALMGSVPSRVLAKEPTNALMAAADRQGVQPMAADVGGPMVRRLTAAAAQGPVSSGPVIGAGQRVLRQSGAAVDRAAGRVGTATTAEGAGESAIAGAKAMMKSTSRDAGFTYERAAKAAGDTKITPANAVNELDRHIAELADTPGGADAIAPLTALREELANGSFSIEGIRRMRTVLRSKYLDNGLTMTDTQRRVNQVIDAASDDVADSLTAAGKPGAASLYRKGDKQWRERMKVIEDTIAPIIGKKGEKSGEQVVKALELAAQGNGRRVQSFMSSMTAEEANTIRATFIDRMGRAKPGALTEEGERVFSLDTFLTRWDSMSPRAKVAMFDKPTRSALNDVAVIARGSKAAGSYANRSNTSGGVAGQVLLSGSLGAVGGFPLLVSGAVTQYISGHILAHPGFARWIAGAPRSAAKGASKAWVGRLSVVASREPAIANEVTQLQQQLMNALNDNAPRAGSAVASPDQGPDQQ